jgi:hypothetical protein
VSKKLRPRRGAESAAVRENILLEEGELFMEFQSDRGEGFGPGRLIVGNGNSRYTEKINNTDSPTDFQPFITDPQIYIPLFEDSNPQPQDKAKYGYEDSDRGYTKLKDDFLVGIRSLPYIIGIIKNVLCRHTDNLRYDNDRITALEDKIKNSKILDIGHGHIYIRFTNIVNRWPISENECDIPSGYTFYKWEKLVTPTTPSTTHTPTDYRIGFVKDEFDPDTMIFCGNGNFLYDESYRVTYYYIKENPED